MQVYHRATAALSLLGLIGALGCGSGLTVPGNYVVRAEMLSEDIQLNQLTDVAIFNDGDSDIYVRSCHDVERRSALGWGDVSEFGEACQSVPSILIRSGESATLDIMVWPEFSDSVEEIGEFRLIFGISKESGSGAPVQLIASEAFVVRE